MGGQPIDDIAAWSEKLSPWRQDCLRRLAISNELNATDFDELLALIKLNAGFTLATQPPTPVPFTKAHFGGGKHQPIVLKGIANVRNVNRLAPNAGLTFCPKGLTVVYGRNGNELCRGAESVGIEPVTIALFSDKSAAGKIDPAGIVWKGLNVAKRIGKLGNDLAPIAKLHLTSPADYEYQIKNLYGRLRDTYERVVEEIIFRDIVRRGSDVIQTQLLRYVRLSDRLAIRFHEGMTKANTHSHDNPAADTISVPTPDDFKADIAALETLIEAFKAESAAAEAARPQMKPKK